MYCILAKGEGGMGNIAWLTPPVANRDFFQCITVEMKSTKFAMICSYDALLSPVSGKFAAPAQSLIGAMYTRTPLRSRDPLF